MKSSAKSQIERFKERNGLEIDSIILNGRQLAKDLIAEGIDLTKVNHCADITQRDEWVSFSESPFYTNYKTVFPRMGMKEYQYNKEAFELFFSAFRDNQTFVEDRFLKNIENKIRNESNRLEYRTQGSTEETISIELNDDSEQEKNHKPRRCSIM